ncbi:MAG: hypothetical protein ACOYT4_03175 [Nanoarchaeota archaeon]
MESNLESLADKFNLDEIGLEEAKIYLSHGLNPEKYFSKPKNPEEEGICKKAEEISLKLTQLEKYMPNESDEVYIFAKNLANCLGYSHDKLKNSVDLKDEIRIYVSFIVLSLPLKDLQTISKRIPDMSKIISEDLNVNIFGLIKDYEISRCHKEIIEIYPKMSFIEEYGSKKLSHPICDGFQKKVSKDLPKLIAVLKNS